MPCVVGFWLRGVVVSIFETRERGKEKEKRKKHTKKNESRGLLK